MTSKPHQEYCINESRISTMEQQLKHKRYELNELNEKLTEQAKHIDTLVQEVTKLATLLQETQSSRIEHGKKIDKLEPKVTQLNATMNTLKWIITISIALFGGVIVFLITNLIQLIH